MTLTTQHPRMPGAIVLAGFPPLPYGHLGLGPVAPTLSVLVAEHASSEELEGFTDALFNLTNKSMPRLCRGGELRPLLHATLASMVMYYEERFVAKEMHTVLAWMQDACTSILGITQADAHTKLITWGRVIKEQFDMDNIRLTGREEHEKVEQLITVTQKLGVVINSVRSQLSESVSRQIRIEDKLDYLISLSRGQPASEPPPPAPAASSSAAASSTPPSSTPPPPVTSKPPPPLVASSSEPSSSAASMLAAAVASRQRSSLCQQQSSLSRLSRPTMMPAKFQNYTLVDKASGQLYLDAMELGGNVPLFSHDPKGSRKSDATLCYTAYNAMAFPEERTILLAKDRDPLEAIDRVNELTKLLLKRIREAYGIKVPARFGTGKTLVSTICEHLRKSKLHLDAVSFHRWRKQAGQPSAPQPSAPQPSTPQPSAPQSSTSSGKRPVGSPRLAELPPKRYRVDDDASSGEEGEESGEESSGEESSGEEGEFSAGESSQSRSVEGWREAIDLVDSE